MSTHSDRPMSDSDRYRNRSEVPRGSGDAGEGSNDRFWPLVGLAAFGALVLLVAGLVIGGWTMALPVLVLVAAGALFVGAHRAVALRKTEVRDGRLVDATAGDNSDPVPHVGMDAGDLGNTPQAPPGGHDIPVDAPNKGDLRKS
jgi:hypothetical protein